MSTRFTGVADYRRGLVYSSTATAFPNTGAGPIPTTTKPATVDSATPTGNLVVISVPSPAVDIMFFGTDAANEVLNARVVLWRETLPVGTDTSNVLYVPHRATDVSATLGTCTGVSGGVVSNTEYFCDTIADLGSTIDSELVTLHSNGANFPAYLTLKLKGSGMFGVYFDIPGSAPAASMNMAYACHDYDN